MKHTRKAQQCSICGGGVHEAFLCRRCGRELRALLVGDRRSTNISAEKHPKEQPGIVWYIDRLRETAYLQTAMDRNMGSRAGRSGYAQLAQQDALEMLAKIHFTLHRWNDRLDTIIGAQVLRDNRPGVITDPGGLDGLDGVRAARIAVNIATLRHKCEDIASLYNDLIGYAKESWRIINRPDDICCGPCPQQVDGETCGVMLYASEEHPDEVVCPKCRTRHDAAKLREDLKRIVSDMLFTGPELLRLMKIRLNDKMPKSTFYQLIRDGRLLSRGFSREGQPQYTYDDVCAARDKPKPRAKKPAMATMAATNT